MRTTVSAALLFCLAAAPGAAGTVSVELLSFKLVETTDAAGAPEVLRAPAAGILPGDRVLYRIELANAGTETAEELAMELPVAAELILDPESFASDAELLVTFATRIAPEAFAALAALDVPTDEGGTRPATPEDLGAVRVEIAAIGPDAQAFVEYAATLR